MLDEQISELNWQLEALQGGTRSIAQFADWFDANDWNRTPGDGDDGQPIWWRVENLLHAWRRYPDDVPVHRIIQDVRDIVETNPALLALLPSVRVHSAIAQGTHAVCFGEQDPLANGIAVGSATTSA